MVLVVVVSVVVAVTVVVEVAALRHCTAALVQQRYRRLWRI